MEVDLFNYDVMFRGDCKNLPSPESVFRTDPLRLVGMYLYARHRLELSYNEHHSEMVMDRISSIEQWLEDTEDYLPLWFDRWMPYHPA